MRWLFIGNPGSCSSVHVDLLASNGWMYLFSGRKYWKVGIPKKLLSQRMLADQKYCNACDSVCEECFKPANPYFSCFYEGFLEAGQTIFVPGGAWHSVKNCVEDNDGQTLSGPNIAVTHNAIINHEAFDEQVRLAKEINRQLNIQAGVPPEQVDCINEELAYHHQIDALMFAFLQTLQRYDRLMKYLESSSE